MSEGTFNYVSNGFPREASIYHGDYCARMNEPAADGSRVLGALDCAVPASSWLAGSGFMTQSWGGRGGYTEVASWVKTGVIRRGGAGRHPGILAALEAAGIA